MNNQIIKSVGIVVLGASLGFNLFAQSVEPGFTSLFNGKDLTNWAGRTNHWSVQDGVITGTTTKENPAQGNNFLILQQDGTNASIRILKFASLTNSARTGEIPAFNTA